MNDSEVQRFLGAVEARTTMLERRMEVIEHDIKAQLTALRSSVIDLRSAVDASRGGWRAIAWFVGVTGSLAALLTTLYHIGAIH